MAKKMKKDKNIISNEKEKYKELINMEEEKGKKYENDTEVLNFMEIVENIKDEIEESVHEDVLAKKPLQCDMEKGANRNIDNVKETFEMVDNENEETNMDNSHDQVVTNEKFNLFDAGNSQMYPEYKKTHQVSFINDENIEEIKTCENISEVRNSENISEVRNSELEELNNKIKDIALKSQEMDKRLENGVILLENDKLQVKTHYINDEIMINKFPGLLFINIYSVDKYISSNSNIKSVSVKMETRNFTFETKDFPEDTNIKMNSLTQISLKDTDPFNIKFILVKKTENEEIKSSECNITINKEFINKIHNNLLETTHEWTPYSSTNLFKNLLNLFTYSTSDAYSIKLYFSFISEEEFKIINFPPPNTLYELGRWLKVKKYSYSNWFSGFCNIRGNICNVCTYLWKRRYIKIHGYKVYIFNEHTKQLMGIYDLLTLIKHEKEISEDEHKIKIKSDNKVIEFHFDGAEKYEMFKNVLEALL